MVAYNKFNVTVQDMVNGSHQFGTHTYKLMLTNTAPVATNAVFGDLTEIAAGGGYSAGGITASLSLALVGGTENVSATTITFNATGTVGPFRYAVIYNFTQTTPNKPLVAWWDNGSAITLNSGDQLIFTFGSPMFSLT